MNNITVLEFTSAYPSRDAAAKALGVTRQTLYNWEKAGGNIPDLACYKARALLDAQERNANQPV